MTDPRILVAGMGNIFLGDDAFGVEVSQALLKRALPDGVRVVDYGIRGFDLAFAMLEEWDAVVLVDATARGAAPGTLYLIEADVGAEGEAAQSEHADSGFQGHSMTPDAVFALVRSMGGRPPRCLVLGCEPETLGPENEGQMGLSDTVMAVVPAAVERVERLVSELLAAPAGSRTVPGGTGGMGATQQGGSS